MKRLTHLSVTGLKNLSGLDLDVPPLLVLSGPNGAGKTAVLQSVRLAVLGFEPQLGRTLAATRRLAAPESEIEVALTFEDGFGIRRTFGASTETELAPPADERTEREKQDRIDRETGAFVPSFDLTSFLALSSEKRRAMLFGLLPRERAGLDEETFREWLGYEEAQGAVRDAIDRLWMEHVLAASSAVEGLASALAFVRERFLEAERDRLAQVKVAEAASLAARERTEAAGHVDPADAEGLKVRLEAVVGRLGELREQEAESGRARVRIWGRENRIRALERERETACDRAQQLHVQKEALGPPAHLEEVEAQVRKAEANASAHREALAGAVAERASAAREAEELLARAQALAGKDECPTCGNAVALGDVLAGLLARKDELQERLAIHEVELAEARADQKELEETLAKARLRLEELVQKDRMRGSLEDQITSLELQDRMAGEELESLRRTEEAEPATWDPNVVERLQREAHEIRERLREIEEAARLAAKAEAERERADREHMELGRRTTRAESLKRLKTALEKLRAHVIRSLVGPVEETANELLQAIDANKRFRFLFEREEKDTFDFGFEEEGVFRSYDAASTGEDRYLEVVLVAALIAAVAPPWPVLLLDNAESLDRVRLELLMVALARPAIAERLGNIVLSGCCPFPSVAGWSVVRVEGLTASAEAVA